MRVWSYVVVVVVAVVVVHLDGSPLDPVRRVRDLKLNSWIRHYQPAHYDQNHLQIQHRRLRRSLGQQDRFLRLNVTGHGRTFRLKLRPDDSIFAEDSTFESTSGPINFNKWIAYTGTLEDNDEAVVHGVVTSDGLFEGTVSTNTEDYHIEPTSRYLRSNDSTQFHSIVYKASDVQDPRNGLTCASHILHKKTISKRKSRRKKRWLLEADAKYPYDDANHWDTPSDYRLPPLFPPLDLNNPYNQPIDGEIDIETPNRTAADLTGLMFRNVNKRAVVDPKKTTCMLYLQADHQFFTKYGTEEACIEVMTRHVQRVNAIYRRTDFNQDGKPDNISFMVKRIKVHTIDALKDPHYRFPGNYGVEKFLELFSEEDYDAFCLAYMFTYRDFEMGTLGLAWTGDLKNAGGVCEKNGHYRGSMKSLNTGIVTLLNYGKHVPPAVSHVTLAHEIGHNFGSPHDPEQCTPGGEDGNFIMFARATSGDKKNNNHFSPCSLKSINPVLNFKARSTKGCFTEPQASLCGNGVVEEGEECDCGWEEDCRDQCCYPQRRYPPLNERPCHLTPGSACSPSQGPCCTSECRVKFGDKCRDDNGCRDASFCNGRGPHCPPSINKPNKTICNKEFVCFMGECTGSICLAYGLESCQCIPEKTDPKTKACELCCKFPGDNQPCVSSFDWNEIPYDIPDMYSKPGTPCNDYSGYCDVFQKCREIDPSGPLATLRKLLLSGESIASFKKWVLDYWYAVALIVFAVLGLLVLSTKFLGKHQNIVKSKKAVTIMHNSPADGVCIPPGGGDKVTVHPAVRSKLPLKRKVREGKMRKRRKAKNESVNNNVNSPKKSKSSPKKKNRVAAAVAPEEVQKKSEVKTKIGEQTSSEQSKKPSHQKKKQKKVIDYSCAQIDGDGKKGLLTPETVHNNLSVDSDPVGKVQNWLLRSHQALPKSKSTPAGFADKPQRSPRKQRPNTKPKTDKSKSHSVGNLPGEKDKVRLQVVYKPPFKFSVKLRKPEKVMAAPKRTVRTGVVVRSVRESKAKDATTVGGLGKKEEEKAVEVPIDENIDSNTHTVQSDLEVLLSESEFLFSD